ncbi:hypothetical protein [Paenibacillus sp. LPE1-1-1.1]
MRSTAAREGDVAHGEHKLHVRDTAAYGEHGCSWGATVYGEHNCT